MTGRRIRSRMRLPGAAGVKSSSDALRHTYASWAVQNGCDLYQLQMSLGHSTPMLTQRYAKFAPGYGQRAADAVDAMPELGDGHQMDTKATSGQVKAV